jgi:Glycerophosphoryl diester phosphodiesterase
MPFQERSAIMKKPLVYAHRGASAYMPENTLAAFKKAIELGADGIELDVHVSSDGHLMVIHDEKVDRTSNGKGLVKEKTFNELKSLDFGSWFSSDYKNEKIPELNEVLDLISQWHGMLNIEVKNGPVFYPGIEKMVIDAVASYNMIKRVIVSSFNHYSLVEIKKLCPGIKTAPLYMEGLYEPWVYAKHMGAGAIHPAFYSIIPEIVSECGKNGIAVNPFTVDQPQYIKMLTIAGVDGIITNVPDIAIKTIKDTISMI